MQCRLGPSFRLLPRIVWRMLPAMIHRSCARNLRIWGEGSFRCARLSSGTRRQLATASPHSAAHVRRKLLRVGSSADASLRVWAAGDEGPPRALLLASPEPGLRGQWKSWLGVTSGFLERQGGAVWIVEWRGFGANAEAEDACTPIGRAVHAADCQGPRLLAAALADLLLQVGTDGNLKLLVGTGGTGILALQAFRLARLQCAEGKTRSNDDAAVAPAIDDVSVVAIAPTSLPSPLRQRVGDDYPARLARRQRMGRFLYRLASKVGAAGSLARIVAPSGTSSAAQPAAVVAWWLSMLDPVADSRDAIRELLLAGRAVHPEAGVLALRRARAEGAVREAAADDADDEELATSFAGGRSSKARAMQGGLRAEPVPNDYVSEALGDAAQDTFVEGTRAAAPVVVLLPEASASSSAVGPCLMSMESAARRRLDMAAAAGLSRGFDRARLRVAAEQALIIALMDLDVGRGAQPAAASRDAADVEPAVRELVLEILPTSVENMSSVLEACATEKVTLASAVLAERLSALACSRG